MTLYTQKILTPIKKKLLELMNEFTKEYRINKPKSTVFLQISNEQSPNEIKKTILN